MNAVRLLSAGKDPEGGNISEERVEVPSPGVDEVLLRVEAVGVCHRDIIDRNGGNRFLMAPITLGHEVAGTVEALGRDSAMNTTAESEWEVGARVVMLHRASCGHCAFCRENRGENSARCMELPFYVYGITHDGGYQQYLCVHRRSLVRLPDEISFSSGCFLYCTAAVARRALCHHGRARESMTVLITGATGGVGVHAVQLARSISCTVIATTSSAANVHALLDLGAHHVIVIERGKSFQKRVLDLAAGGVDIALELVGEPTFNSSLRCLKPTGRIVVVGNISTTSVKLNLGLIILNELHVSGSSSASGEDLQHVFDMVIQGMMKPLKALELPLCKRNVLEAHRMLSSKSAPLGRVVLSPFPAGKSSL